MPGSAAAGSLQNPQCRQTSQEAKGQRQAPPSPYSIWARSIAPPAGNPRQGQRRQDTVRTVHIRLPRLVQSRKGNSGILPMPAGTEISVRMPGTSRPHSTTALPWRLNQRLVRCSSATEMPTQRPWRCSQPSMRSSFTRRPMPYHGIAPSTVPSRPAKATGTKCR